MARRTAAGDRSGYWFPLVLLGFGLLVLLGWETVTWQDGDFGWFAYGPDPYEGVYDSLRGVGQMTLYGVATAEYPVAPEPEWPWAVLLTATLVGTTAWYGVRARRAGRSARRHGVLAVAGGVGVPAMFAAVNMAAVVDGPELASSVGVPLVLLAALSGGWAYFRHGPARKTVLALGVACAGTGVATVLGSWAPELLVPVLVAGGLATVAWAERSRVVAAVAVVVPAALAVLADDVLRLLLPAVILLVAAIVALARRPGAGAVPEAA